MADIQSNIRVNIDTSDALASIKALQSQISAFQKQLKASSSANAVQAENLQRSLISDINATGKFAARLQTIKSTTESFTTALEKNKLSMGEYFQFGASQVRGFRNIFSNEFNTIEKVARERVKTLQTQYISLGRDANGALKAISVRPLALDMDSLATRQAIAAQRQQIFNQLLKQGSTNLLNFGKNTQWAGRQLMVGFTIPLSIFGTQAARTFMEIEEQAIRFRRVYGELFTPAEEADSMLQQLKDLGLEFARYGVAVKDTLSLAADAAAMGKTGVDLTAQVSEATRLAVLGSVDQQQALETTISLTSAFGTATAELANKINFLNAVENQTVVSIEDLTVAIPKAGPVVKQLGGDVEDLAFFLTAMKEGGINASEGANALKSGLASLINPTEKAAMMLKSYGINIREIVESNRGDIKGVVVDFANALDQLDPLSRARAIEQLFGKFQFARISTLFQNVISEGSQAARVLELTNATTAELAQLSSKELARVEESTTFKFRAAVEEFQSALAPIGEEFLKLVTPLINFGTDVLNAFNNMSDGAKRFVTGIVAVLGGIAPVAIMTFGLLANGIANMIKGFAFVRTTILGFGRDTTTLGSQLEYMTNEQLQAASVAASLDQIHSKLTQTFTSEKAAVDSLTASYNRAVQAGSRLMVSPIPTDLGRRTQGFAGGGIIKGPGTGTSDSIIARVSNGEAIIPAASVRQNPGMVSSLISGNMPGFADGGIVGGNSDKLVRMFAEFGLRLQPSSENMARRSGTTQSFEQILAPLAMRVGEARGITPTQSKVGAGAFDKIAQDFEQITQKFTDKLNAEFETTFSQISDTNERYRQAWAAAGKAVEADVNQISSDVDRGVVRKVFGLEQDFYGTMPTMPRRAGGTNLERGRKSAFDPKQTGIRSYMVTSGGAKKLFERRTGQSASDMQMGHVFEPMATSLQKVVSDPKATNAAKRAGQLLGINTTSAVVNGIKESTKQASPSKEAQQAGKNIGIGAINGISEYVDDAKNVGAQLGSALTTGTSQARRASSGATKFDERSRQFMPTAKFDQQQASRQAAQLRINDMVIRSFSSIAQKAQGASFALSSVAGIASMFGGTVGDIAGIMFQVSSAMFGLITITELLSKTQLASIAITRANNVASAMGATTLGSLFIKGKGLAGLFTNLGRGLMFGLKFLGPVGIGLSAIAAALPFVINAFEEQRKKLEAFGNVVNVTADQLKYLGDQAGVTVIATSPLETATLPTGAGVSQEQVDAVKQTEEFRNQFSQQIEALKAGTAEDMNLALQALAFKLASSGLPEETVKSTIVAIMQEAARTDISFDFNRIAVSPENITSFIQDLRNRLDTAIKQNPPFMLYGSVISADTRAIEQDAEVVGQAYGEMIDSIARQFNSAQGEISVEEFRSQFDEIREALLSASSDAKIQAKIIGAALKSIQNVDLRNAVGEIKDYGDQLIVLEMIASGVVDDEKIAEYINLLKADPLKEGNEVLVARTKLQELMNAAIEDGTQAVLDNAAAEEQKAEATLLNEEYETALGAIRQQTQDILLQNQAYKLLVESGWKASEAIEAVADSNFMAAFSNAANDPAKIKEIADAYRELAAAAAISVVGNRAGGGGKSPFQEAVDQLKNQRKELVQNISAYSKLRKAGFGVRDAFEAAQDPTVATALATTKVGTAKWKQLVSLIKQLNAETEKSKLLNLVAERKAAMGLTEAFTKITPLLSKLGLSADEIKEILGDPTLAQAFIDDLKDGEINSKNILYYINQIPKQKQIDILFNMATPEGMTSAFEEALSRQMELFNLQERAVEAEFRAPIKAAQEAADAAQEQVDRVQDSIDKIQTTIGEKQREIELSIDRPIEELNRRLATIERQIDIQYARPIADLQEESSDLSNDLTLIDRAAEGINEKYDKQLQALEDIADVNAEIVNQDRARLNVADALAQGDLAAAARAIQEERARRLEKAQEERRLAIEKARETEIAAIRSASGMTRAEIEERQFAISQQIFALEEQRELKQTAIQDIQDQIFAIEQRRIPILTTIQSLEDQIYTLQTTTLLTAEAALKTAQDELQTIEDQKQARLDAVEAEKLIWQDLQDEVNLARVNSDGYLTSLEKVRDMVRQIKDAWAAVGTATADAIASITGQPAPAQTTRTTTSGTGGTTTTGSVAGTQIPSGPAVVPSGGSLSGSIGVSAMTAAEKSTVTAAQAKTLGTVAKASGVSAAISVANRITSTGALRATADTAQQLIKSATSVKPTTTKSSFAPSRLAGGGMIPYKANGGLFKSINTDNVPAMLTPGEFVVRRFAVEKFGAENLKAINNGTYRGDSMYNYEVNVNVKSDANPDQIARAVMTQIKQIDSMRLKGNRF